MFSWWIQVYWVAVLTAVVGMFKVHQRLTFTALLTNSADDKLIIFFLFFSRKWVLMLHVNCLQWIQFAWNFKTCFLGNGFDISYIFSFSQKTGFDVCMKRQNLFSEKRFWHVMQKTGLTFHANYCLQWRQFAWNVKTCFLGKIEKYF